MTPRAEQESSAPAAADYRAYLAAVSELNTARMAVILADKQRAARQAALEEAVQALGADPLGALAPRRGPGPHRSPALPGQRIQELLPLLPGRTSEIARRHGGMSAANAYCALQRAEKNGLVRREKSGARTNMGTEIWIWHPCDNGDA